MLRHTSWAANIFTRHMMTFAKVGLASILAGTTSFAAAAATVGDRSAVAHCSQRYEDAMRVLDAQRYAAAFGCLAALADRGDPQAARMALALLRYRPSLAGAAWSATDGQQQHWQALANDGGKGGFVMSALDHAE